MEEIPDFRGKSAIPSNHEIIVGQSLWCLYIAVLRKVTVKEAKIVQFEDN